MSDASQSSLHDLLNEADLLDKAHKVDDSTYNLMWGSAMVVVGMTGRAMVALAPLFKTLPPGPPELAVAFMHRLLKLNGQLGGVANFALQDDGWVVLHAARDVHGMDAEEFNVVVRTVARYADQFDDELARTYYGRPSAAPEPELLEGVAAGNGAANGAAGDSPEAGEASATADEGAAGEPSAEPPAS
ncbi:MAG: YbjN domain-containing protein [Myxococcota bacterium]